MSLHQPQAHESDRAELEDRARTVEKYAEQLQNDLATARARITELEHQLDVARRAVQKRAGSW